MILRSRTRYHGGSRSGESSPLSCYKGAAVRRFFKLAKSRRVDWIDLGDSNEVQGGHGRNHGIQFALVQNGFQLYGPGVFCGNENNGVGASMGYLANSVNNGARPNDNVNCPTELNQYNPFEVAGPTATGPMFSPHYAWYMSDAQADNSNQGFATNNDPLWEDDLAWTWSFRYGKLTTGAGNIRPNVRLSASPFTVIVQSASNITTAPNGSYGLFTETLAVPAGSRSHGLNGRWSIGGTNVEGPAYLLWMMASIDSRTTGLQYHTMIGRGGQGAYEFIQCVTKSDPGLDEFLSFTTSHQNGPRVALICINTGLNDRNDDGLLSLGPIGNLDSATPAGYRDNIEGIVIRIRQRWSALGYDLQNLFFLLQPSHPVSNPDDSELIGYRNALNALADKYPNIAVQDLAYGTFNTALQANSATWYASGGTDKNHMTQTGYEQFLSLIITDLERST